MNNYSLTMKGWLSSVRLLAALSATLMFTQSFALTPQAYFSSAEGLEGWPLKSELRSLIDGHTVLSYTPGVWNAHKDLYEDRFNSSKLILFYSNKSFNKSAQDSGGGGLSSWNREHLWPRSRGVGDSGADNTDLFHLVPVNAAVNTSRGNKYFDESDQTDPNYDADPASNFAPDCTSDTYTWEPSDLRKGWVARAMFYMTTRYSHLFLSNASGDLPYNSNMAQLDLMLEWNRRFLPTDKEREVNEGIYSRYQGNRNPYIDFPEFADATVLPGQMTWGGWRLEHFSLAELLDEAVSGDLADPDADGIANIVEMARYSDPRTPDSEKAVEVSVNGNEVTLSLIRARSMEHLNLSMVLEEADTLGGWSPVSLVGADVTHLNDEQERVSVVRTLAPDEQIFVRVFVERP